MNRTHSPYRIGHAYRSHGTIAQRWLRGLLYYAPLTDIRGIPVSATGAGIAYGGADARTHCRLNWAQDSGTITNDLHAYYQGGHAGFQVTASVNNGRLMLVEFPGQSSPNNANITGRHSVAGWCRVDEIASAGAIAAHNVSTTRNYSLVWDTNGMHMSFTVGSSFKNASSGASLLTAGVWAHWVGTYDKTAIRLYKNGKVVATTNETGNPDTLNASHNIGSLDPGNIRSRACVLREVAVWNERALSSAEVVHLYNTATLFEDYHSGMSPSAQPLR